MWLDLAGFLTLAGTSNSTTNVSALTLIKQAISDAGLPGFRFVVGPQLSASTRIIGVSSLVEVYEQQKGLLSLQNVSHLGLDVAYRGYLTHYTRTEALVKLT